MDSTLPPLPKYGCASQEQVNLTDYTQYETPLSTIIPKPVFKLYPLKSLTSRSNSSLHSITNRLNRTNDEDSKNTIPLSARIPSLSSQNIPDSMSSIQRQLGALRSQDALFPTKTSEIIFQTEIKDQVMAFQYELQQQSSQKMILLMGISPSSRQPSVVNINISRRNSVIANIATLSRRASINAPSTVNQPPNIIHQRRSSLPVSSLMPLSTHLHQRDIGSSFHVGVDREVILSEYVLTEVNQAPMNTNADYYNYVYSSQHMGAGSLNFINRIESSEIAPNSTTKKIKTIGRFLIGDQVGKGAFGKVKEGICTETLLRVAVKIISKKRARKVPNGVQSIIRFC